MSDQAAFEHLSTTARRLAGLGHPYAPLSLDQIAVLFAIARGSPERPAKIAHRSIRSLIRRGLVSHPFRVERVVVPPDIAADIECMDIQVSPRLTQLGAALVGRLRTIVLEDAP